MFNTVTYYYVLFKIVSLTPKSISMKGMSRTGIFSEGAIPSWHGLKQTT